jgi:hypothetical protein
LDVQVVVDLLHCRDVVFIAAAVCALQEFEKKLKNGVILLGFGSEL